MSKIAGLELCVPDTGSDLERLVDDNYQQISRDVGMYIFALKYEQSPHSDFWTEHLYGDDIDRRNQLLASLKESVVVDLGCGDPKDGSEFKKMLHGLGVRHYIGIDRYFAIWRAPWQEIEGVGSMIDSKCLARDDELDGTYINGDMLWTLHVLPDASVNVAINGIDEMIVPTGTDYAKELEKQIERVVPVDGLVFGITTAGGVLTELATRENFEIQNLGSARPELGEGGFLVLHKTA